MTIEMKNIKVHLGLSEETYAYTATVYLNGKKAAEVSNRGHGGCDMQYPANGTTIKELDAYCAANFPAWELWEGEMKDQDLEHWCGGQVSDHLVLKDMRRALKARPMFTVPDREGLLGLKFKGVRKYDPRMADIVRERYPDATILNELPEDKALAIYSAEG